MLDRCINDFKVVTQHCRSVTPNLLEYSAEFQLKVLCVCRIFGGLVCDIKRKAPFYWSDVLDGFRLQCVASVLFLYCACMSPVITFGGLLGEATKSNIVSVSQIQIHNTQNY